MSMPKIEASNVNVCDAIAALLQSIALEETAISHILNAEGEKIQKSLTLHTCEVKDLLDVNKSVQDTIEKVTCLEVVLKEKLSLITPLVCECEKRPPKMME